MSFSLKKILSFFLEPFTFAFLLAFLAFIFLLINSFKKAKISLFLSLLIFFLSSSSLVSNSLINPLEQKYQKKDESINKDIKYLLLLGGDFKSRAYEVLKLYKKYDNLKVITSGYEGNRKISSALFAKNELISLGIDEKDILIQEEPKDTIEEAIQIKKIVKDEPFFLVTSASHMPRAIMIFESYNLKPIAISTAFEVEELISKEYLDLNELRKTHLAIHEYLGIIWLKIKSFVN